MATKTAHAIDTVAESVGPERSEGELGRTTIAEVVVSTIAGLTARDVNGVYAPGAGTARALGSVRERIPGARSSAGQGVVVEVVEANIAVGDMHLPPDDTGPEQVVAAQSPRVS